MDFNETKGVFKFQTDSTDSSDVKLHNKPLIESQSCTFTFGQILDSLKISDQSQIWSPFQHKRNGT